MKDNGQRLMRWVKKYWWLVILIALLGIATTIYAFRVKSSTPGLVLATETVKKGTLVSSIAASGNVTSSNITNIATKASGVVKKVYVQNGEIVKKGQKILEITLDSEGIERKSAAWETYLKAKEEVKSAELNKQDLTIRVWQNKQAILDTEKAWEDSASSTTLTDAEKHQKQEAIAAAKLTFDETAVQLENADAKISAAKIAMQAAYLDYQDVSGTIVAPAEGIVNNLTLTEKTTLVASTNQSTTTGSAYASSQTIGYIRSANNQYQAKVSLTEADIVQVKAGQKVNITMDAYPGKTFTGKVLAVDIAGSTNSGVTAYPATILIDPTELDVYPNMTVSAVIITKIENEVLTIPSSAITTNNEVSTVQVMKDSSTQMVEVILGSSNGTKTVVKSGLNEGDVIVTSSATSAKNNNEKSAFSSNRPSGAVMMGGPGL